VTKPARKAKGVTANQRRTNPKKVLIDFNDNESQAIEKGKEIRETLF
jgi:hypothetical protein